MRRPDGEERGGACSVPWPGVGAEGAIVLRLERGFRRKESARAPVSGRSQEEGAAGPVPGERRQEEKSKVVA